MEKVLLKTESLSKSFSSGGALQQVLKNIDLELYEGDFTVIRGQRRRQVHAAVRPVGDRRGLTNSPDILYADVKWSMVLIVYCVHSVQKRGKRA